MTKKKICGGKNCLFCESKNRMSQVYSVSFREPLCMFSGQGFLIKLGGELLHAFLGPLFQKQ